MPNIVEAYYTGAPMTWVATFSDGTKVRAVADFMTDESFIGAKVSSPARADEQFEPRSGAGYVEREDDTGYTVAALKLFATMREQRLSNYMAA